MSSYGPDTPQEPSTPPQSPPEPPPDPRRDVEPTDILESENPDIRT
jgi:hypothetical protein